MDIKKKVTAKKPITKKTRKVRYGVCTKKKNGEPKIYKEKPNGKKATGRPNTWNTPEEMEQQIGYYFDSISITKPMFTETTVPLDVEISGQVVKTFYKLEPNEPDEDGDDGGDTGTHRVRYKTVKQPKLNNLGEQMYYTEWYEEPSVSGLALYLKVDPDTILNYEGDEKFFGTVKQGKTRIMKQYEKRFIARGNGGDTFAMKNFGWKDKIEVENTNKNFNLNVTDEERAKLLDRLEFDIG